MADRGRFAGRWPVIVLITGHRQRHDVMHVARLTAP